MKNENYEKRNYRQWSKYANTISMISAVTQATLDNMKILPKDDSSKSTNNTDACDAGNYFGGRDEAQANKRRKNNK